MPSENDCPRSSVLPLDANSSHFALSTPAGGASPCYTSRSLASVHRTMSNRRFRDYRRPPTHAVNQLTHRNKSKAEETPI
jgi:hypothetical protein